MTTLNLSLSAKALHDAVNAVKRAIPKKFVLESLACVLLDADAEKGTLKISATNLELTLTADVDAEVFSTGQFCIEAKALLKVAKTLKDEKAPLRLKADFTKRTPRLAISIGHDFTTTLIGVDPGQFPPVPVSSGDLTTVTLPDFKSVFDVIVIAASEDDARPALNNVHLTGHREAQFARLEAVDGFCLTRYGFAENVDIQGDFDILLSAKHLKTALAELGKSAITFEIDAEKQRVYFCGNSNVHASMLLDIGYFPDLQKMFPSKPTVCTLTASCKELSRGLELVELTLNEGKPVVELNIDAEDNAFLFTKDGETGTHFALEPHDDGTSGSIRIGVNKKILSNLLKPWAKAKETVHFFFYSWNAPVLLRYANTDFESILMPMNLDY